MAKYKCIGVTRKTGEYQGTKYDNCNLFVTFDADGMIAGQACKMLKVKTTKLAECFEGCKVARKIKQPEDLAQLVGQRIKAYCDDYGNPEEIFICE